MRERSRRPHQSTEESAKVAPTTPETEPERCPLGETWSDGFRLLWTEAVQSGCELLCMRGIKQSSYILLAVKMCSSAGDK